LYLQAVHTEFDMPEPFMADYVAWAIEKLGDPGIGPVVFFGEKEG
jgi:hypothetical protein